MRSLGKRLVDLNLVTSQFDARSVPVQVVGKTILDRGSVIGIARAWHDAGARVVVSEGEPVKLGMGEEHYCVSAQVDGVNPAGRRQEWITVAQPR